MSKVVLDINLFIAAYWNPRSASARIIRACLNGELQSVYTAEMERGLWRILRNIRARQDYIEQIVEPLLKAGVKIEPQPAPVQSEDPEDQAFLDCAYTHEVDYLITSDRHLLKLGYVGRAVILTPTSFVQQVDIE